MADREIWVAGYPSFHGGADTELLHQIIMLRKKGVKVTLVPMGGKNPETGLFLEKMGCFTRDFRPSIFKDRIVAAFCNGNFLKGIKEIMKAGKPRAVLWANCMTWTFPNEVEAHRNGWITHHLFQTNYQKGYLIPLLQKEGPVHMMPYLPYYDTETNPQGLVPADRPTEYYGIGRVSRDDQAKYSTDMWKIMDRVNTPGRKKVFILGFGEQAKAKCGPPLPQLDWATWGPGGLQVGEFYPRIHTLVHRTGGSRENLPRVMMEAWHSGTALVCEDDYGFAEHIINGVTGFRCKCSEEMSFRASQLAFDSGLRKMMVLDGRKYLSENFGDADLCYKGWDTMFKEVLP